LPIIASEVRYDRIEIAEQAGAAQRSRTILRLGKRSNKLFVVETEAPDAPAISVNYKGSVRVGITDDESPLTDRNLWQPDADTKNITEQESGVRMSHMIGRIHEQGAGFYVIAPYAYFSPDAQRLIGVAVGSCLEQFENPNTDAPQAQAS